MCFLKEDSDSPLVDTQLFSLKKSISTSCYKRHGNIAKTGSGINPLPDAVGNGNKQAVDRKDGEKMKGRVHFYAI